MATKTFNTRIANKRDTSSNWTTNNPVLLNGEIIIVDTEAGQVRYKVGNGTSTYTQLPFTDESLITNINGKLSLSGGTMTGNINMGGHKLTGLGAPVNSNDAVRQADLKVVSDEVDGIIAGTTAITLPIADDTKIGGVKIGEGVEVADDGTISVASGLTQEQADERYLRLTGGAMTGPIYLNAVDSPKSILSIRGIPNAQSIVRVQTNRGATLFYFQSVAPLLYGSIVIVPESNNPDGPCRVANIATPISDTDVANKAYVDSKSPTSVAITLSSSSWSSNTQTVTVSGVSATETAQLITPTPAIASQSAYYEAGIMCTGQAANSLTFTCQTVPTSNLTVYVVIQPLS